MMFVVSAEGVTHLHRWAPAPDIDLQGVTGERYALQEMNDQVVILVFGELYHHNSVEVCGRVEAVLKDKQFQGASIVPLLVITQAADPDEIRELALEKRVGLEVLRDTRREAFESYRVAVLPSVVVIDPQKRVVHSIAAIPPRFDDLLTESLRLALGKINSEQFDNVLNPQVVEAGTSDQQRAHRLGQLARQLARRHLPEMAVEKYTEALSLDPSLTSAHIGLGTLRLDQRRLDEAEIHFNQAIAQEPQSLEASLGLAFVLVLRGGEELEQAQSLVRETLKRSPNQGRAHYLMGLIHDQSGDLTKAAASYKKAAEILLAQSSQGAKP
ncbi:MAG: peroxiredoxin family protein [Planctomycetota bacterium]